MPDPSTAPPDRARGARRALPALVVALVVGASFSTALGGGFIWDDHNLIEHNRNIRELSDIPRAFTRRFWDTGYELGVPLANVYYRPLVTLSFAVDYQLWGGAARGFHLTNVLLHVAVSLLVYWLLLLLLRDEGATPANDNHSADSERGLGLPPAWVAAVGALIFALHPSRAEAVAWISGRTDVMMALFFVLALGLFYRALRDGPTPRRVALAWLAFVCAMLCKENAVALAVVVPAADALLLGRDRRAWLRNARWSHGPLIVLTLVFVAARVATGGERPGFDPTLLGRLNLIASSVGHYGWMFINGYQPNPAIGAGYHPGVIISGPLVGGIVTIVASLALLVFGLRRAPRVAWATTLLGATLAPVCNIVPLALVFLVADRFIYLPWLGVTLLVLLLLQSLPRRLSRVLLAVLLALATTWSVTVALRSRDFSSDYRFWLAAVTVDPENPLALRQLARELAQRGRYRAAERHLMMALQHARGEVALKAQVMVVALRLMRIADHDQQLLRRVRAFLAGLEQLSRAAKPQPRRVVTLGLGSVTLRARVHSERGLLVLRRERAQILELLGVVESRLGFDARAVRLLEASLAAARDKVAARLNLALAQARSLDVAAARRTLAAISAAQRRQNPRVANLLRSLALVEARLAAATKLGFVVGKKPPDQAPVLRKLAEVYVLLKTPARAARLLRRAIELQPADRTLRVMLALELAASGDLRGSLATIALARQHFGKEAGLDALEQRARRLYEGWRAKVNR